MKVVKQSVSKAIKALFHGTDFGSHKARCTALAGLLVGLLYQGKARVSAMARGSALLDETKTFRGQLKRAFRLVTNAHLNTWEIGNALFKALCVNKSSVLIGVDWTKVNKYWVLEAGILVDGRAIPIYSTAVHWQDIKGRQRSIEQSMEYALAAMVLPNQIIHILVDQGFASYDYVGPSLLYPSIHRITRLKKNMILQWDDTIAPFSEWPLEEGEVVEIEKALLGRKKVVLTGIVIANVGGPCYLACHPSDVNQAYEYYEKRFWIEEQNRDLKTIFKIHLLRFKSPVRLEKMWGIVGIAFSLMYSVVSKAEAHRDRLSRKYTDGRKDLSWVTLVSAVYSNTPAKVAIVPLVS